MASLNILYIALLAVMCICDISAIIEPPNLCDDPQFDTIFSTTDGKVYVFKGSDYWLLVPKSNGDGYMLANGYPKRVNEYWRELPVGIDASYTNYAEGKTYFFKGDQHWRYSGQTLESGYPKPISQKFKNIPNDLDLGFVCTGMNYFSKGEEVWNEYRINPRSIVNVWTGLPDHLTSAVQLPNAPHTYFFKDTTFYKLKRRTQKVETASPPYPHDNKYFWFGCADEENVSFQLPEAVRR